MTNTTDYITSANWLPVYLSVCRSDYDNRALYPHEIHINFLFQIHQLVVCSTRTWHTLTRQSSDEILRLELSHQCKRRAEEEDVPLRQIFDDIYRTSGDTAQQLSFADLEASMYKRRRRATPTLPTTSAEADAAVRSSRYAQLSDGEFYRGLAEAQL